MSSGLFITGTDTDAGKTIVTAGLLRYLRNAGVNAISMKPVQTGAEKVRGQLVAPDLLVHQRAAGLATHEAFAQLQAPYLYEPACSPHLAGRMAGSYPEIPHIIKCANTLRESHDALLIEGAGGILAPIDEERTMLDLTVALGYPVLLVARRGLGTINHSLLSIKALRDAGVELLGIVFNETQDVRPDFIKRDNPGAVCQFSGVEVLGDIDYLGVLDETAWTRFEACMPGLDTIKERLQ